ncbi:TraI/MobA(P) family conjugative relaxase [Xanthomonas euvesicatoria]|uniref:TraI/MobA(P) family conjugative relaxase n=1 Tax=Xanthomonas euvesicatoria TaxID=456327 RepID=UPI001C44546E|nr:TraI/MobA(P) family conjugative relaxase [Xanthomonas euvesicatoria]MBV6831326.1 relaxase/mobilization nuclease domain-containing protein [Xanthomonas campestris pv. viegasii]
MIAKHVSMRSLGKSDFAGLVNYITDAQSKDHRLGQVQITNCDAVSVQDAITEVLATQHANTRAKGDKTYHLIVSFRAGEQPSADTLRAIEERICAGLGYGEHQRVSAVHNDTDNLHIHIAINKIHPTRRTMHEPYYSHRALAELCTALERDYGLERDNHEPRQRGAEGRAADMERHAGVESLVGWIKRECLEEIKGAQSWQELHQVMRDNGLELRERANGLVIEAGDGTMVKASTLARDLSKPKLEARLGPFEASPERQTRTKAKRQYQKEPIRLRVNTVELYARYKAEQQTLTVTRGQALGQARQRKDRLVEAAKRSGRLRRAAIKLIGNGRANKKLLYAQASKALRDEIQAINKQYQQDRQALYDSHSRRTWADWLKKEATHGNAEALAALRAREAAQGLQGNTIQGRGDARPGQAPVTDNITKKGTIIFRAGLTAVRDDGDKLQVSREATRDGLQEALRLAMERYGSRITVNGTTQFQAQIIRAAVDSQLPITFADPALESRRLALLKKENTHERTDRTERAAQRPAEHRGRTGRGAGGIGQRPIADQHTTRAATVTRTGFERPGGGTGIHAGAVQRKPDIGRIGRVPPPQSQHRLRTLSQLGVVRIAGGSEVLLPRDVPRYLEQQGTQPDHELRRGVSRPGTGVAGTPPGLAAADKYIAERESKRLKGFDIPKHARYTASEGALSFQGVRNIEGQALALLKRGDAVMVMPIDQATARRLSRIAVGDAVTITPKGSIRTSKGRSR